MLRLAVSGILLVPLLLSPEATCQTLLGDLNQETQTRSSAPRLFAEAGGWTYFFAEPYRQAGHQLHRTQGTSATTQMVADLGADAIHVTGPAALHGSGSQVFFLAYSAAHGRELWTSDGTSGGTRMLLDLAPGPASSNPEQLIDLGGNLYFVANDIELWKSDGTSQGTVLVRSFPGFLGGGVAWLSEWQNQLYFGASDGSTGRQFWCSDGTAAGTIPLTSGNHRDPQRISATSNRIYFYVEQTEMLFVSDGTVGGTTPLVSVRANKGSRWAALGNLLVFSTLTNQLWRSDGTVQGTFLLHDLGAGQLPPGDMTVLGSHVFTAADDGVNGVELWKSDGTVAGTGLLADQFPGSTGTHPRLLVTSGNRLFFVGQDAQYLSELFSSDGSASGTRRETSLQPAGRAIGHELHLSPSSALLYFDGFDGVHGAELWKSDGSPGAAVMVSDIQAGTGDSDPQFLARLGRTTLFTADDGIHGRELWRTDGSPAGTWMVKDINGLSTTSLPRSGVRIGDQVLFSANDALSGSELWKTDGTAGGTVMVKDIDPGPNGSLPSALFAYKGRVYFAARRFGSGTELWVSDGTEAGTTPLAGSQGPFSPNSFFLFEDELYFQAFSTPHGIELWKTDGSPQGTVMVHDIHPGPESSLPYLVAEANGALLMIATSPGLGTELWKTDGTSAGTTLVLDIEPGPGSSVARDFQALANGLVVFVADTTQHGRELWRTDATSAGTVMVRDLQPGPSMGVALGSNSVVDDVVFFSGSTSGDDWELWRSDGSLQGTQLVHDFNPQGNGTWLGFRDVGQRRIYLPASDGQQTELHWAEPGGAVGTHDLWPGQRSSYPEVLGVHQGQLLVAANDGPTGRELWLVPAGAGIETEGVGCGAALPLPELRATTPTLGSTWQLDCVNGAPGARTAILFSSPIDPISMRGGACELFVIPLVFMLLGIADQQGAFVVTVPIPNDAALSGAHFASQGVFLPSPGHPLFELTNGLSITLGD